MTGRGYISAAGAIGEKLRLPPATLSFHLAGLTRAGLAQSRQESCFVIYNADYAAMNALVGFLTRELLPRSHL